MKTEAEARDVLKAVSDDAELRAEMKGLLDGLGGLGSLRQRAELWSMYLRLYDSVTPYSAGYQQLIRHFHERLPEKGQLADFGAGTGSISAGLVQLSPDRFLTLVDRSAEGLALAEPKMRRLGEALGRAPRSFYVTRVADLALASAYEGLSLDGGVMNNVLYSISPDAQTEVLSRIHASLKPGAPFLLSEPDRDLLTGPDVLAEAVALVALDAVRAGAPVTDYELALGAYINYEVIGGRMPPFLTSSALRARAEAVGFRVREATPGLYYGLLTVLWLER